jgi:hypothetical protein
LACPAGTTNVAGDDAFGSDTQCDSTVTYEIWGWTESQVTVDFIADGGDWESEGLGIDAGDVVLATTCSSDQASCAVGDCSPAPTAPDSPIIDGPLNVALTTENGYLLYEVHMDAEESPDDIPQTGKGNPQVAKFETGGDWDILSPGSSWASDTDADLADGKMTNIALHGVVFIPNGCAEYQDLGDEDLDGYYTSCEESPFDTDVESCANELDHCSGEGAWVEGKPFNVGKKRSWAMYLEAEAADFCTWAKVCDSPDGNTCNN